MLSVAKPGLDPIAALEECCCDLDLDIKYKMKLCQAKLKELFIKYDDLASKEQLFKFERSDQIGALTKEIMISLYSDQMVKQSSPGRMLYDELISATPNRRCPMCGVGIVGALDHHLPKSSYFNLSIFVSNLVPICHRCNDVKKHTMPNKLDKQFIHPYFDNFEGEQWVSVVFHSENPIRLSFEANPPIQWHSDRRKKLISHFTRLKLGEVYLTNAIDELNCLREVLAKHSKSKDWTSVESHLKDCRDKYSIRQNSWQHVLYRKLCLEKWYIQDGFLQVG